MRVEWVGTPGKSLDGADVHMGHGVVLELATVDSGAAPHRFGLWAIRIGGVCYPAPRIPNPTPLSAGSFKDYIEEEAERAIAKAAA